MRAEEFIGRANEKIAIPIGDIDKPVATARPLRTLHRTASGKFNVADAIRLEELVKLPEEELPRRLVSLLELVQLLQPE